MLGKIFFKGNYNSKEYSQCAEWCNNNNATIVDKGDYYECVAIPKPTLDSVKTSKISELKMNRDLAEQLPVTTEKGLFDVDDKSITRITNARDILSITNSTLSWTLADNTVAEVTSKDLQDVIFALAMQSNEVHEKYRLLKEKVESCTTKEEVEAITWDTVLEAVE